MLPALPSSMVWADLSLSISLLELMAYLALRMGGRGKLAGGLEAWIHRPPPCCLSCDPPTPNQHHTLGTDLPSSSCPALTSFIYLFVCWCVCFVIAQKGCEKLLDNMRFMIKHNLPIRRINGMKQKAHALTSFRHLGVGREWRCKQHRPTVVWAFGLAVRTILAKGERST